MAVQEISIARGRLKHAGTVHGALNMIVTFFDAPDDWKFVQFISEEQMNTYAQENALIIEMEVRDASDNGEEC